MFDALNIFHCSTMFHPFCCDPVADHMQAPLPKRDAAFLLTLRTLHSQLLTSPVPAEWTGRPVAEYLVEEKERRQRAIEELEKSIKLVEVWLHVFVCLWEDVLFTFCWLLTFFVFQGNERMQLNLEVKNILKHFPLPRCPGGTCKRRRNAVRHWSASRTLQFDRWRGL